MTNDKSIITGPEPCPKCGQIPVIVKSKGRWRVACPCPDCKNYASAYGATERSAVDKWNKGEVIEA